MNRTISILAALFVSAASPHSAMAQSDDPTDWRAAAARIVSRLALVRGERVLLVAVPGAADALVPVLREAIRAAGGSDLGAVAQQGVQPLAWSTDFTNELAKKTGGAFDEDLSTVDAAIMMPGATVTDPAYAGMQRVLRSGHGRTVHFHWAGAYDEAGVLLPTTPDIARVYLRALLETDYAAIAAKQRAFEAAMRGKVVRVTTPRGTDLRFRIGDRPVTKLARNLIDREVELPAGAVRVAPIESSVEGTIAFPPSVWGGTPVEGLVLTFARGQVTGIRATTGREAVERELAGGGSGARAFRELAVGFNPLLEMPAEGRRWIPYYGYGAGVIRLSLGDNTELGGEVGGGYVRWNFFTDATVAVGSDIWVQGGKLVR